MLKTALTLTEDQLQRMVRYVRSRIEEMEAARCCGWIADRERFEREWNDDFSYRVLENAVFARSNESLNMIGSGVDYIRSRLIEEIFGGKPWFCVEPRRLDGQALLNVDQMERHLRWKLGPGQIDFQGISSDLVTQACKLGECVAKLFYKTEEDAYERIASILWDTQANEPVLTADGAFVFQDGAPDALAQALLDSNPDYISEWHPGEKIQCDTLPEGLCWKEQIILENKVRYAGAKAVPLHFKEFYCPLNAPTLHEADFVAHMTSMRLSALCAHLGVTLDEADREESETSPDAFLKEALLQIREAAGTEPKTPSEKPIPGEGEEFAVAGQDPEFRVLEAYFQFDARGDGRVCRVFVMIAYDFNVPIFWDYIANVTPDGKYPFEAVVMNKEPHRWYGKSWFRKFERFQRLIDKLMNQILYRNDLAANPVKFRRKEAVVQWQDEQPFEIGPDKVFDLNDGYTAEDALQTARIPELDEQTKTLLEMVISNWRVRSGITTATQGEFGGLPSERTATGIEQVASTSMTLFKPQMMEVRRGLEAVLRQVTAYQYAYMDADETFAYMDGDRRCMGLLTRKNARNLELDVELTLTLSEQEDKLASAQQAVAIFNQFLAVPDAFKPVAAPLFECAYKSLQIDNATDYFQRVVEIAQGGQHVLPDAAATSGGASV